jgi:hypothetical protein
VDAGEVLVVSRGEGEVDEVRLDAGKTMASSACSFSSRREGGRRLEAVMASGDNESLVPLRNKTIPMNQEMRQRVRRQIGEKGRTGAYWRGVIWPGTSAGLRCSVERFRGGQAMNSRGSKGRRGRMR